MVAGRVNGLVRRAARRPQSRTAWKAPKKLQDIFTDLKIPQAQRENWPVVECGGEIIWLPGYRIARNWKLSSDSEPALHLFSTEG